MGFNSRIVLISLFLSSSVIGQELSTIFENGPTSRRINIVVLSEGFTEEELSGFTVHASSVVDHIFSEDPFQTYKDYFNAYALAVPSNESGADEPDKGISVDTAFDATFNFQGIGRFLVADSGKVVTTVIQNFPEYDIILVLVNSTRYGGSGGFFSVSSLNSDAFEIANHEIGHSFAKLTDEYEDAGGGQQYESPNSTQETTPANIKWRAWFEPETPIPTPETGSYESKVGLFEGAIYAAEGWYRPHLDSKMRTLGRPWGQVNTEQILTSVYQRINLFDDTAPKTGTVNISQPGVTRFEVLEPLPETTNFLAYTWKLDGIELESNESFIDLSSTLLTNGTHTLDLLVHDTTPWVQINSFNLVERSAQWQLEVDLPPLDTSTFEGWADSVITLQDSDSPLDDPDFDGLTNLEEFFHGTDPMNPNLPEQSHKFSFLDDQLQLEVHRTPSNRKSSAFVEASTHFETWTPIAISENGLPFESSENAIVSTSTIDGKEATTIRDHVKIDTTNQSRQLRLRIELPSTE